ncbi:MAG: acyl-CoA dehydrogenase family protein [Deltaproteobacteria bacterium]|nr:acyl-CoA dehydrogenase family protein [Deltaproteobacteria bacterium]
MTECDREAVEAAVRALRRFAREKISDRAIERRGAIPRELLTELAELGAFGLSLPAEYGGAGMSLAAATEVVAALAESDRSVATSVGLHLGLGSRGLVAFGTESQKARWLPGLASGATIAAFAATEPNAGSDLAAIATTLVEDAGSLRLSGQKAYVTNGGFAGVYTVLARSPGLGGAQRGHSLVLVDRADEGVEVGAEEHKLGLRASSTTPIEFDVRVGPERILGEPGAGMSLAQEVLAFGRTLMSAGCAGAARTAVARTVDHVSTRKQFGRVLIAHDVVKDQVAKMASESFAIDALVEWAASAERESLLGPRSISAKVFASEACGRVCDLAIQLHGGSGFIEDIGVSILARDARVTRIFEGANDVLLQKAAAAWVVAKPRPEDSVTSGSRAKAAELRASLTEERDAAVEARGVRLFGDARAMHGLGALAIWADAVEASAMKADRVGTPYAAACFEVVLENARRALAALRGDSQMEHVEAIVGELRGRVS